MPIYLAMIEVKEDKDKLEQLYITYKQTMFYVANRILKDEYLSEDVVHQAFLRIIGNLSNIDKIDNRNTKRFICVIAENIAIDLYRKRKRENSIPFDEVEIYLEDIRNENNIITCDIREAILYLPINYSIVIKLKYLKGFSDKEISKILGITKENIRQRLTRGRKKLAEILTEEGGKALK